jgi:hypothetical protein
MKLSKKWDDFMAKLDRIHPKFGTTLPIGLEYGQDEEGSTGS